MNNSSSSDPEGIFVDAVFYALTKIKEDQPDRFFNLFHSLPTTLLDKIGWCLPESALEKLHDLLEINRFISCSTVQFIDLFLGTHFPSERVTWYTDLTELVYLYYRLRTEGIVPDRRNPHTMIVLLFTDKYGKSISPRVLTQTLHKVLTSGKEHETVDSIISIMTSIREKLR